MPIISKPMETTCTKCQNPSSGRKTQNKCLDMTFAESFIQMLSVYNDISEIILTRWVDSQDRYGMKDDACHLNFTLCYMNKKH